MVKIAKVVAFTAAIFLIASSCGDSSKSSTETSIQTIEPGSLKVCLYPGFAPFAIKGEDGTWSGWDVEFLEGFAKQQGLTLKPVEFSTFDNIWMRPGNDECDLAGTGITKTADRSAATGTGATWSSTYYSVARGFAVLDGVQVNGIGDLAGRVVLATKGSTADLDLQARIKKAGITNITLQYVDAGVDAAKQLLASGSNAPIGFAEGVGSVQTLVQQFPGLELAWQHCMMLPDGTISSEPFGFPVRAKSTGVAAALDSYTAQPTVAYPGGPGTGRDCPTGS